MISPVSPDPFLRKLLSSPGIFPVISLVFIQRPLNTANNKTVCYLHPAQDKRNYSTGRKEITGVLLALSGLAGIIYSGVGIFDDNIYRNPLPGIMIIAMIFLATGVLMMKSAVEEA